METVGDTTDKEVALALTFKNGGLTWQKDVTLPVSRIDSFLQIKLAWNTATTSDNREFFYYISNISEMREWEIKEEPPQGYSINFYSSGRYTLNLNFTSAITETQNMAIKYKLQKTDGLITHISPEYTLEVTATYTPPKSNP